MCELERDVNQAFECPDLLLDSLTRLTHIRLSVRDWQVSCFTGELREAVP